MWLNVRYRGVGLVMAGIALSSNPSTPLIINGHPTRIVFPHLRLPREPRKKLDGLTFELQVMHWFVEPISV